MSEDDIKKIVRQSVVKTSDTFTNALMQQVELQKKTQRKIKKDFFLASCVCIVLILAMFKFTFFLHLLNVQFNPSTTVVRMVGALFVFLLLNKMMVLRGELLRAEKKLTT